MYIIYIIIYYILSSSVPLLHVIFSRSYINWILYFNDNAIYSGAGVKETLPFWQKERSKKIDGERKREPFDFEREEKEEIWHTDFGHHNWCLQSLSELNIIIALTACTEN